jgi:hypothetical protein
VHAAAHAQGRPEATNGDGERASPHVVFDVVRSRSSWRLAVRLASQADRLVFVSLAGPGPVSGPPVREAGWSEAVSWAVGSARTRPLPMLLQAERPGASDDERSQAPLKTSKTSGGMLRGRPSRPRAIRVVCALANRLGWPFSPRVRRYENVTVLERTS